ncbi:hydantoinase B/oxoprolinase family protein [Candidatus Puniceispirillum sp.]|nr:hydantoinase B/oxoprolinase family protein [Candidatus Puniceispirillum sp.]
MTSNVDPITLEVFQNALSSIADELALVIMRSAYSNIVRDSMDYSTAVCDCNGLTIAQGLTTPVHLGSFPHAMRSLIDAYEGKMSPGDVFIFNDPYEAGGMHLPDFYVIKPVFVQDRLEGYVATLAHQIDVGGIAPGGMGVFSQEIFQEGLRIPILKLFDKGQANESIFSLIKINTRMPESLMGDLRAQISACNTGEKGMISLVNKYDGNSFREHCEALHDYAEKIIRKQIAKLPDGKYKYEDYLDGVGENPEPIKFCVSINIKGDHVNIDWTGTSQQVKAAINGPLPTTHAMSYLGVRCAVATQMPNCEGYMRAISVTAPKGSIVNPFEPAACGARGIICFRMFDTLLGAFAQILPDRIPAANEGGSTAPHIAGRDVNNKPFMVSGGLMGCWGGNSSSDGVEGISNPAANLGNTPIELLESRQPIEITKYAFITNSGGPGCQRGGVALVRGYRLLEEAAELVVRSDRRSVLPYGLADGLPGTPSWNVIYSDGNQKLLPACPMESVPMKKGDEFIHYQAGAGGYGDPLDREPDKVLRDTMNELFSLDYAAEVYGVIIENEWVSEEKTAKKRKILRADKSHKDAYLQHFHKAIGVDFSNWKPHFANKS